MKKMTKRFPWGIVSLCVLIALVLLGAVLLWNKKDGEKAPGTTEEPFATQGEEGETFTQELPSSSGDENGAPSSENQDQTAKPTTTTKTGSAAKTTTTAKPTTTTKKPTTTTKPNTDTHTHAFSDATCTEPQKCSCGSVRGSALGHSFSEATCTQPAKCTRCGTTQGSAKGHNWKMAASNTSKICLTCGKAESVSQSSSDIIVDKGNGSVDNPEGGRLDLFDKP